MKKNVKQKNPSFSGCFENKIMLYTVHRSGSADSCDGHKLNEVTRFRHEGLSITAYRFGGFRLFWGKS